MISVSGMFAVTFSIAFAYVADCTEENERSTAYGLVRYSFLHCILIRAMLHECQGSRCYAKIQFFTKLISNFILKYNPLTTPLETSHRTSQGQPMTNWRFQVCQNCLRWFSLWLRSLFGSFRAAQWELFICLDVVFVSSETVTCSFSGGCGWKFKDI